MDSSLSFLDGFVSEALAAGAAPYKPPHQRQEEMFRSKGRKYSDLWPECFLLCLFVLIVLWFSALSLEPYGLSLPISMSSCSITDRQSPTLLSMSSGLSGDSAELPHKGRSVDWQLEDLGLFYLLGFALLTPCLWSSSTTLKLDGVKRVWGREGYLAQKESGEEAAQVEASSPLQSPNQRADEDSSHSQTPTQTPDSEQEKQQLASSLFVGLASQSSGSLVSLYDFTYVYKMRSNQPWQAFYWRLEVIYCEATSATRHKQICWNRPTALKLCNSYRIYC